MVATTALPVLDIAPYVADEGSAAAGTFVDELRHVAHEIGFFHVTGHGIDAAARVRVLDVARQFFALPDEQRFEIDNVKSPQFRGYTRFGHEHTNGRVDLRDQIDIGRDLPHRVARPDEPAWLRLRGPNLWPSALPELRPVVTAWMARLEALSHVLLRAMALALGQPPDRFEAAVTPPEVLLKVIRYLAPEDTAGVGRLDDRQGVGAHRDTGFLTLVYQDAVGGLQVERDGRLIDVPSLADTFVVNVGEMFQLVTRGYFKATVHRVVSPPAGTERVSLAYSFGLKK